MIHLKYCLRMRKKMWISFFYYLCTFNNTLMMLFKHLSVIILLIAFSIGGNLFHPEGCDSGPARPHITDNRFDDIRPFKDHSGLMTENITVGTPQVITLMPRNMASHHQSGKRDCQQGSGGFRAAVFLRLAGKIVAPETIKTELWRLTKILMT